MSKKITLDRLFEDHGESDVNSLLKTCKTTAYLIKGRDRESRKGKYCPFLILTYDELTAKKIASGDRNTKVYQFNPPQKGYLLNGSLELMQIYPN